MKKLLCLIMHKRVITNPERGYAGGVHCSRCGKVIMKPIIWPPAPPAPRMPNDALCNVPPQTEKH